MSLEVGEGGVERAGDKGCFAEHFCLRGCVSLLVVRGYMCDTMGMFKFVCYRLFKCGSEYTGLFPWSCGGGMSVGCFMSFEVCGKWRLCFWVGDIAL